MSMGRSDMSVGSGVPAGLGISECVMIGDCPLSSKAASMSVGGMSMSGNSSLAGVGS